MEASKNNVQATTWTLKLAEEEKRAQLYQLLIEIASLRDMQSGKDIN